MDAMLNNSFSVGHVRNVMADLTRALRVLHEHACACALHARERAPKRKRSDEGWERRTRQCVLWRR